MLQAVHLMISSKTNLSICVFHIPINASHRPRHYALTTAHITIFSSLRISRGASVVMHVGELFTKKVGRRDALTCTAIATVANLRHWLKIRTM
jgi:hypothetical protein